MCPIPLPLLSAGLVFLTFTGTPPVCLTNLQEEPAAPAFPNHWGPPPAVQTRDLRDLPGGYGRGSSTLAGWIQENLDRDAAAKSAPAPEDRAHGDGSVAVSGILRPWHKVTLSLQGPFARERDADPNPFTGCAFNVRFTHSSGEPTYMVPGYFAADGSAANTSAEAGRIWRAHLSPDKPGLWNYSISFVRGELAAVGGEKGEPWAPYDGLSGHFTVEPSLDSEPAPFSRGRLRYVDKHHLQFAASGGYFLKAGPDAPETLLAYVDFDGTTAHSPGKGPLKTWEPHLHDWRIGDPSWQDGKGKGLIGALNYLASKGLNAFSFLTYNPGGDGDNVWPFVERNAKFHYDCSKLDQWGIVFDHAASLGLYLHFKMQENEIDDDRTGDGRRRTRVPESLDGGSLGPERRLYCRELIARFAHALALNWNLGEENTQSTEELRDMAGYLHQTDPYRHPIVVHTYPGQQDQVYNPLLGEGSLLSGVSLQNSWSQAHQRTLHWVRASAGAGRPWVVANDEQNPASHGVPPDPGYQGHDGVARQGGNDYTLHEIRKFCLWGNLMAGGAGVEYYFGYELPENDLLCEDFRSRDRSWDYCRYALAFFQDNGLPFASMTCRYDLVGNPENDNSRYCLAAPGDLYAVYLPGGGACDLNLADAADREFDVRWFDPRAGGELQEGSVARIRGPGQVSLGEPPSDPGQDWAILVR